MRRIKNLSLITAITAAMMMLIAGPALAAYPPGAEGVGVQSTSGGPGGTVTVGYNGFMGGSTVNGTLVVQTCSAANPTGAECSPTAAFSASGVYAQAAMYVGPQTLNAVSTASAAGTGTLQFVLPANAVSGSYTATAFGTGSDGNPRSVSTSFDFTVSGAAFAQDADAGAGGLPSTGGEFTRGAALAAAVLILGAALVVIGRRRSDEDETVYTA